MHKSSPEELIRKISESADQLEMESEELADEYVNNDYDGGDGKAWEREFLAMRTLYHRRKALVARFQVVQANRRG